MFRKLLIGGVAVVALVAVPGSASAALPAVLPHHKFDVMVLRDGAWVCHGTYRLHAAAEVATIRLRHHGMQVEIRQY
jgi:hypothetical protein